MNKTPENPQKIPQSVAERHARAAQALKDNLRRRKQVAKNPDNKRA